MTTPEDNSKAQRRRFVLALVFTCIAIFALLIALLLRSEATGETASSEAYRDQLATALAAPDWIIGEKLSAQYECNACHMEGDGSAAPLFAGLGDVAATRRAELDAEQYLYEAIVYPSAHLVAGYTDAMPNNYADRLSLSEIGDLIAYLQTFRAEP
ncbi:MAG: c-type cytochrome [Chloroflexi bacterium]|nr:c-type cytochrome [Chloroflexota bacterium]MCY3582735.1 c-type cytochrome [Chloroflexota bacterium]MCY3717478.1 c-type cytochrome [Chloroflexota bacterium]MDE2652036.1 c-type cytochrome [Chloroflexota bacterium]MXX49483.1 cytochrome c [Chloroflexota bacterium]